MTAAKTIDLNADVAEGFPYDHLILPLVSSANVCCGAHAGNAGLALATLARCKEAGVTVGAHMGLPDRLGMGRAPLPVLEGAAHLQLVESLIAQTETLVRAGVGYLKPHGTLYNESAKREDAWSVVFALALTFRLPLMGLPGTLHERVAEGAGVRLIREGFADRAYRPDGSLVPRSEPGALLEDPAVAAEQAVRLAAEVDSLCVHGDTPGCVAILESVRVALEGAGYEVRACV